MAQRATIKITENFLRNLDQIEEFLESIEQRQSIEPLLDELFDTVIPNLEQFPFMGKDFLAELPQSVEGVMMLKKIRAKMPEMASIRQYLSKHYLILYLLHGQEIALLAIKHPKQLYFNIPIAN
jgi:hypothetical protein